MTYMETENASSPELPSEIDGFFKDSFELQQSLNSNKIKCY